VSTVLHPHDDHLAGSAPVPQKAVAKTARIMIPAGLVVVVAIYLLLATGASQILHFSRALDEGYHLEYVTFIKQHGRLPLNYQERSQITRADFPPLYHLLVAAVSAGVEIGEHPDFKYFWDSFRYRAMDHYSQEPWSLDTEDFQWPYAGRFLVWQIGRWLSIGLSLATVLVVYFALRETPLGRPAWLALAGAALLAFIPRYVILGASLNDDNLLGLLAALYFWMLLKAVNTPRRWWPFALLGVLLGLAMTVKYTLVLMPLEIVLVAIFLARKNGLGLSWSWQRIGLVALLALLCSSWWFGWNIWFLNTVAQDGLLAGTVRPLLAGGTDTTLNRLGGLASGGEVGLTELPDETNVGTFPRWMRSTFVTFWAFPVAGDVPFSPYAFYLAGGLLAVAAVGLWQRWQQPENRPWLALFALHIGLFLVLPLLRFWLTRRLSVAAQGRHILIPAAVAIVGLLVWGLAAIIPHRWRRLAMAALMAGLIGWTGGHLYQLAATAAPPLPLRTSSQAATWLAEPVGAQFGETIELASYSVDPNPAAGLLRLNLAWRALGHNPENYLLQVELINTAGQPVTHWLGHTGQGRVPTLSWQPNDVIFDRLALPLRNVAPDNYTVQLQLLGGAGPLAVNQAGQPENREAAKNILTLGPIPLESPAQFSFSQQAALSQTAPDRLLEFSLWQAGGPTSPPAPPANLPTFRYPATIALVTAPSDATLELLDPAGQPWPAARTAGGIHIFVIGPRWPSGDYRLHVTWPGAEAATTGPLLTVANWWERRFDAPSIETPLVANFANQIRLLGYKLPQKQVQAGQAFPVTLYWQAPPNRSPQANFTQFNHLLDGNGRLRGGYDRQPLEYYSTLLWAPGEVVVDGYAVPVDADAPPGQYYLNVGYYLTVGQSAVDLPLVVEGEMSQQSSVSIGPIEVVSP